MSREKKESLISITHIVQGYEHIYITKLDYRKWEQVKQFLLIQYYRPLQTFSRTYLPAWIQIKQLSAGEQKKYIKSNCSPSANY